jgi:hypothetical protein
VPLPPAPAGAPARARAAALRPALLLGLGALWVALGLWPAWRSVQASRSARDYASYHYAVQEALDGGDPYDTAALSARARAEGTRDEVHPYFYPPPFLLLLGAVFVYHYCTGLFLTAWLFAGLVKTNAFMRQQVALRGAPPPRDFFDCTKGLSVYPQLGKVIVFYSMHPSGELDPLSLHGGWRPRHFARA